MIHDVNLIFLKYIEKLCTCTQIRIAFCASQFLLHSKKLVLIKGSKDFWKSTPIAVLPFVFSNKTLNFY